MNQSSEDAPLPIVMFYPPGEYEISVHVRAALGDGPLTPSEDYVVQVVLTITSLLEEYGDVVLVPLRQGRYLELVGMNGPPFGTTEAQDIYLDVCEEEDGYVVNSVECFWMLWNAAILNHLTRQAIVERCGVQNVEECLAVLDVINDAAEDALDDLTKWLGGAGAVPAKLSYVVETGVADAPLLHGVVGIKRINEEGLYFDTATDGPLASGVLAQGVARTGKLVARCGEEGSITIYGWRVGPEGLTAMSEAEVFDASCVDADTGEPVPPEEGVTYAAAG